VRILPNLPRQIASVPPCMSVCDKLGFTTLPYFCVECPDTETRSAKCGSSRRSTNVIASGMPTSQPAVLIRAGPEVDGVTPTVGCELLRSAVVRKSSAGPRWLCVVNKVPARRLQRARRYSPSQLQGGRHRPGDRTRQIYRAKSHWYAAPRGSQADVASPEDLRRDGIDQNMKTTDSHMSMEHSAHEGHSATTTSPATTQPSEKTLYTCTMRPEVVSDTV
jgi:hypothetical protein